MNIETKTKHLEFIQKTINRMASNSFLLKGWAVTLMAGVATVYAKEKIVEYVFVGIFLAIFFWMLDVYYMKLERRFRHLYDDVRMKKEEDIDFSIDTKSYKSCCECASAICSPVPFFFYGILVIANIGIICLF